MKRELSGQICEKLSYIKFHKNPCSGSGVIPCGLSDGRTDMTKQIVFFRNFANALKNLNRIVINYISQQMHVQYIKYNNCLCM